jgi:hypothetical protein
MAPPTKLTPELQDRVVAYVRAGNYVETAAAAAGVSKVSLYDWLKRGARGEAPYDAFADAMAQAVAMAEARDVALIGKAAETQWQAAAWRLERKFPDRYGRRERHEVSGPDGGPIPVAVDADPQALHDRLAALLAKAAAPAADPAAGGPGAPDRGGAG